MNEELRCEICGEDATNACWIGAWRVGLLCEHHGRELNAQIETFVALRRGDRPHPEIVPTIRTWHRVVLLLVAASVELCGALGCARVVPAQSTRAIPTPMPSAAAIPLPSGPARRPTTPKAGY